MRALTLTQPWASLVANGSKTIETRSWSTGYRGRVAIHAAKGLGSVGGKDGLWQLCGREPFRSALGAVSAKRLPLGAIVAVANLVDVVPTQTPTSPDVAERLAREYAFGDYSPGRFAWLLEDVRPVGPFYCPGALSLWEVPADIAAQLR